MPRKTKEQKELESKNKQEKVTKKTTKKVATSASSKAAKSTEKKKPTAKKSTTKKTSTKKETKKDTKKSSSTTKTTTKKKTTKATSTSKKETKSTKTTKKVASKTKKVEIVEYYDLPYRYNQTIVKVLYQSPTNLFIYWDISDDDRKKFQEQYGENFFENSKPILIIHNTTLNYSFEVEINDFANSWYLHISDSKCDYKVELGRRPITKTEKLNNDYIYVTTSNVIESPNNRILFDENQKMVYFRNVKTGETSSKVISSISFIRNMGKINNIYDLYKEIYNEQNIEDIYNLSNPSSGTKF